MVCSLVATANGSTSGQRSGRVGGREPGDDMAAANQEMPSEESTHLTVTLSRVHSRRRTSGSAWTASGPGVADARANLTAYIRFYNERRARRSLDGRTPDAAYFVALASAIRDAAHSMAKERGGFVDHALAHSGPLAVKRSGDFPTARPLLCQP